MTETFSAMDLWFYHSQGTYDLDARCEMLAEIGYDGIVFTLWSDRAWGDVPRLRDAASRAGLEMPAVFAYLDHPDDLVNRARIVRLLNEFEGCSRLELGLVSSGLEIPPSDERGDAAVLRLCESLVSEAEERAIAICLYPHESWWLQRTEDAVRLCRQLDHPLLRLAFSSYHWYAVDGADLSARLSEAAPFVASANICGSRRAGPAAAPTFELIDEGELDNFAVLGALRGIEYDGPIHLLGYGIGGDVYAKLRRSLEAFRDMEARLERHASWARMSPEVFPHLPALEGRS